MLTGSLLADFGKYRKGHRYTAFDDLCFLYRFCGPIFKEHRTLALTTLILLRFLVKALTCSIV